MKLNNFLFLLAFGAASVQLAADCDTQPPAQSKPGSKDQELIARGGEYRQQSLENRENNSANRGGSTQRQQSLNNRQQNSENRQNG